MCTCKQIRTHSDMKLCIQNCHWCLQKCIQRTEVYILFTSLQLYFFLLRNLEESINLL